MRDAGDNRPPAALLGWANSSRPRWTLASALVGGSLLVAVPLVIWSASAREAQPPSTPHALASAALSASAFTAVVDPTDILVGQAIRNGVETEGVKLSKPWIDRCEKPGPGRTPPDQCDHQPWFEESLVRAIIENTACAPTRAGTVSVALKIDHRRRSVKVFAGQSGSIQGRAAQGLIKCIRRSIPNPAWSAIEHRHTKYILAVTATYPAR